MPGWPPDPPALHLRVAPGAAGAAAARDAVLATPGVADLPPRALYRLELVLEELLMNVTLHAGAASPPELWLALADDAVWLRLEDDGAFFDPTHARGAAPAASLDEARPGGLGLGLVRKSVREWHYQRHEGRNRLTVALPRSA